MTTENKDKPIALGVLCKEFVRDIDALSVPLPFIMQVLAKTAEAHNKEMDKFVNTSLRNLTSGMESMTRPVAAPSFAGMGGGSIYNVNIPVSATINNATDVHELAYVIAREFNRRTNR